VRDTSGQEGDLLVTIEVQVPEELTSEQRAAVESLAAAFPGDPRSSLAEQPTT
jgi:molecular chaperone DnaJ